MANIRFVNMHLLDCPTRYCLHLVHHGDLTKKEMQSNFVAKRLYPQLKNITKIVMEPYDYYVLFKKMFLFHFRDFPTFTISTNLQIINK